MTMTMTAASSSSSTTSAKKTGSSSSSKQQQQRQRGGERTDTSTTTTTTTTMATSSSSPKSTTRTKTTTKRSSSSHHGNEEKDNNVEDENNNVGGGVGSLSSSAKANNDSSSSSLYNYYDPIKVFLRLRPTNKLETSKRSKDCIELHDDPKLVSVESPLQGCFDFNFDMVFDEYASQDEIYMESLSHIPSKLVHDGISCCVMAYGQSGTGKSYTLMGSDNNVEGNNNDENNNNNNNNSNQQHPDSFTSFSMEFSDSNDDDGMIIRVCKSIFNEISKLSSSNNVEVTIRCSYVELYLEKINDLIKPPLSSSTSSTDSPKIIRIGPSEDGENCILGATEVCCLNMNDIQNILQRGNTIRSVLGTEQNKSSSFARSNSIFILKIHQLDYETGTYKRSILYMLDMVGSELGRSKSSRQNLNTPDSIESRMVSASLQSLLHMVRSKLIQQGSKEEKMPRIHPNAYANVSKLTKLLKPALGGNFHTSVILTASPSSYNIDSTLATMRFGQKVKQIKNYPPPQPPSGHNNNANKSIGELRKLHSMGERHITNLTKFCKLISQECRTLRKTGKIKQPPNNKLWDAISKIAKSGSHDDSNDDGSDLIISISKKGDDYENNNNNNNSIMDEDTFKTKLNEYKIAKEKSENSMRQQHSEILQLKTQLQLLQKDNKSLKQELYETKANLELTTSKTKDLECKLRTASYRENEAVVFLRQFRNFYLRLLKSKSSKSTENVIDESFAKIPGAPTNMGKLMDIDKLMVESGLIEESEVGEDMKSTIHRRPSEDALLKSSQQAERAYDRELSLIAEMTGASSTSVLGRLEPGQLTQYRQKLVLSPAGKLAMKQERELEREVLELSHKTVTLQNAFNAEKAMVESLSSRQGALGKMKSAQEMNSIKAELNQKTNDLQAIVWKMNELHLVNKTIDEKLDQRESHITYLEDTVLQLQTQNKRTVVDKLEIEKKLRDESSVLKQELDGMTIKLWQLDEINEEEEKINEPESSTKASKSKNDIPWRFIVPCAGGEVVQKSASVSSSSSSHHHHHHDVGTIVEDTITLLENPERPKRYSVSIQTDEQSRIHSMPVEISTQTENFLTTVDAEVQTDENIIDTIDVEIQTEEPYPITEEKPECTEMETQTDGEYKLVVEGKGIAVQTDEPYPIIEEKPECTEIETQTDGEYKLAVEGKEIAIQTDEDRPECSEMETQTDGEYKLVVEGKEIAIQTEEEEEESKATPATTVVSDISTQTDDSLLIESDPSPPPEPAAPPKPETSEISTQTEDDVAKVGTEAATQTEVEYEQELPVREIALTGEDSSGSLELTQHDTTTPSNQRHYGVSSQDKREGGAVNTSNHGSRGRLPKVGRSSFESSSHSGRFAETSAHSSNRGTAATADGGGGDQGGDDASLQLFNSSNASLGIESIAQDSSSIVIKPAPAAHSRLGASMSAIHGSHTTATVDWRSRMKQQGNHRVASTPQPATRDKVSAAATTSIPRAPFGNHLTPTSRKKPSAFNTTKKDDSPEWLSRYKEMGIKDGEEDDKNERTQQGERQKQDDLSSSERRTATNKGGKLKPGKASSMFNIQSPTTFAAFSSSFKSSASPLSTPKGSVKKKDATPEFLSKFKEMGIKADENDPDPSPSKRVQIKVAEPPEFLSKFKEMGIKADENDPDPEPEQPSPTAKQEEEENESELKKQFKIIGKRNLDEVITEAPSPIVKQKFPLSPKQKQKTPEFLLRFKQMGIDGGEAK